uniref:CST complex subunit CTC1 n=1 Tax=Elaeophora elaphi TaxID=1147741 RepID=A0A158Q7J6_9BILA
MGTSSLGNRLLNRLMNSESKSTHRPNDDDGYNELSRRLLSCLDIESENHAAQVLKHPSLPRLIVRRELGLHRTQSSFGRNALRSFIMSDNRRYILSEKHDAKGFLNVDGGLMVAHKARKIYNIDILEPLCRLDMLEETERILSTLWVELVVDLKEGTSNCSPFWVLILTQNRLLCIDPLHQSVMAEFILPSDSCRFSCLAPNELGRTFCLFGQMLSQSGARGSSTSGTDCVVGVFDVYPLKFKGIFRITKEVEVFGNVTNVSVISDMVIVFKKKPYETVLYNLIDFQNKTEQGLYDPELRFGEKIILPIPTSIISEPIRCARVAGNWSTLEYSAVPYHLLGISYSSKKSYMLVDAAKMTEPASLPFPLQPPKNTSLQIEGASLMFHSDESGRLLRFDGPAIVSYKMQRTVDDKMSFQEVWRTNLWVKDSFFHEKLESNVKIKSSFGRHIKPMSDFEQDFRLVIKGVDVDIESQIIAVIAECDLHSPVFDDPSRPFDAITRRNIYLDEVDMCTVIFLLDDVTGIILKVAMMREPIRENTILHFDMSGVLMCFNQRGPRKSYLEVQRLQEIGAVEWEKPKRNEVELDDIKYNSSVLSRRQTRLRAREGNIGSTTSGAAATASNGRIFDRRYGLPADENGASGSRESYPESRRRKRLRIVYLGDTDSSDSDYRPHSR